MLLAIYSYRHTRIPVHTHARAHTRIHIKSNFKKSGIHTSFKNMNIYNVMYHHTGILSLFTLAMTCVNFTFASMSSKSSFHSRDHELTTCSPVTAIYGHTKTDLSGKPFKIMKCRTKNG